MKYTEFKAWFEGLVVGVGEGRTPSLAQWQLLRSEVKNLGEIVEEKTLPVQDKEKDEFQASLPVLENDDKNLRVTEIAGEEGESLDSVMRRVLERLTKGQTGQGTVRDSVKGDWIKNITGDLSGIDLGGPIDNTNWPYGSSDSTSIIDDNDVREFDAEEFGYPPGTLIEIAGEYSHEEIIKKINEVMGKKYKKPGGGNKLH